MDLKQLRSFIVLAEELHFGRAAKRLNITQSALSQQLQRLESTLGEQLIVRTSRECALTESGRAFLDPALGVIAAADRATSTVQDVRAGRAARLLIGSVGAGLNGPLPGILKRFRSAMPSSIIELHHASDSSSQERSLLVGELDAAIVRRVADRRLINSVAIAQERFIAYLPESHSLANRSSLRLRELSGEDFVFWRTQLGTSFHNAVLDACLAHGFVPHIRAVGDTLEAQLALVACDFGVSLQTATNSSISRAGTVSIPIHDEDVGSTLWIAYLATNRSPVMQALLESVRTASGPALE